MKAIEIDTAHNGYVVLVHDEELQYIASEMHKLDGVVDTASNMYIFCTFQEVQQFIYIINPEHQSNQTLLSNLREFEEDLSEDYE